MLVPIPPPPSAQSSLTSSSTTSSPQTRQRACDSPPPVNSGPGCSGPMVQKKSCSSQCPGVHGGWANWQEWADCNTDCLQVGAEERTSLNPYYTTSLQVRRRSCSSPTPTNSGRYCPGADTGSRTCSSGLCRPHLSRDLAVITDPDLPAPRLATSDLTLYIGLALAFLVLVLVVLVTLRLLQRKRSPWAGYSYTPAGEHHTPPLHQSLLPPLCPHWRLFNHI